MTKTRTTLVLFFATLVLAAFILFVERRAATTEVRLEQARRALRVDPDRVSALRIVTTNYTVSCEQTPAGWMLREPVPARGDEGAIHRVLQHLAELPRGEVISEANREEDGLGLEAYGLLPPAAEITFTEGERRRTLYLGGAAPVGGAHYLMESNSTDVVAVDAPIGTYLPSAPADLRSRRLVHLEPHDVQRLDVRRPLGFLQLTRNAAGDWSVVQPVAAPADGGAVHDLLEKFCRVEALRFVTDGVAAPAPYGLAEPVVEISLWAADAEVPLVVRLGGPLEDDPDMVYASASDRDAVVAVGRHLLFEAGVEPDLLRDRALLTLDPRRVAFVRLREGDRTVELVKDDAGSWNLTKPRRRKAFDDLVWTMVNDWAQATARSFVADGVTNAAAFGLEPPALQIVLASSPLPNGSAPEGVEPPPDPDLLVRMDVVQLEEGAVRVRVNGGTTIYEVAPEVLGRVKVDPLVYYDRTVLSVLPGDVRSITIENGRRQTVVRNEQGVFECGPDQPGTVIDVVITNILKEVGNLRAALFAEENPESLAAYGLDPPAATLTLGLTGEAGISKSLLFGAEFERGVFAMIRGQDTVFLVTQNLRDRLLSDLCVTAAPDEEAPIDPAPTPAP